MQAVRALRPVFCVGQGLLHPGFGFGIWWFGGWVLGFRVLGLGV